MGEMMGKRDRNDEGKMAEMTGKRARNDRDEGVRDEAHIIAVVRAAEPPYARPHKNSLT